MGVHGLWELLAPVGRRVSVETLAGKKLAIDASIWMIQFMKAMRDEKGEMVRNAHILGFFRRICKLLYLRTKPVFVFDGGTPALKRRTVIARRRQRENAQAKIRKTAEKLLLNHLKAMRLKELAADLEKQRQENDVKGKRPSTQDASNEQETQRGNSVSQEELDEMLAASIAAEEDEDFGIGASTSGAVAPGKEVAEEDDDDEDEEMILPEMHGKVDPAVLAALPPSMQLDLLVQMRERLMAENRQKYQKVKKAPERFSELQIEAYLKTVAFRREIDGVQKAAAGRGIGGVQTSRIASEANREFIFSSSFTGDKEALTSVGQERNRADQSQAPPIDSSTTAINKVQGTKKSVAAEGPTVTETGKAFNDDVETYVDERGRLRFSRVRALGIRMTRDLQRNLDLMKESDQERSENHQKKDIDSSTARNLVSLLDNSPGRMQHGKASNNNNNDDGTNNDFDKTEEPELVNGPIEISFEDTLEHGEFGDNDDKLFSCLVAGDPVMDFSVNNSATAEESLQSASDDEWEEGFQYTQLKSSSCPDESQKNITKGALEEDAAFQEAIRRSLEDSRESMNDFHENHTSEKARETVTNEDEVEWEEEFHETQLKSSCPDESLKTVAEGTLEEEAAFQEAIRRSLENTRGSMIDFHENQALEKVGETVFNDEEVEWEEGFQEIQLKSSCSDESQKTVEGGTVEEEAATQEAVRRSLENTRGSMDDSQQNHTSERAREQMAGGVSVCEGREWPDVETLANEVRQQFGSMGNLGTITSQANSDKSHIELKPLNQDAGESGALSGEILLSSDAVPGGKSWCMNKCQTSDTCSEDGYGLVVNKLGGTLCEKIPHESSTSVFTNSLNDKLFDSGSADAQTMFHSELGDHFHHPEKLEKTSADDSVTNGYGSEQFYKDNLDGNNSSAKDDVARSENKEQELMEDDLEEVMMFLDKEREELGSEQRKLERNAESVNNEMFVECQELLQMFGLPYIIAPMEAEAQCAFLELSNQVDGVVTDDSDAFLFGAQSVYKNIFDDRKYVETYLMKDIENELGLDREKIIHMALLLGSDYTEGISGIGIVNAIEVVNAFPGRDGLREFRDWIESPDPSILGKLDVGGNSRKKGSKSTNNIMTDSYSNVEGISCDQNLPLPVDDDEKRRQIFKDKHRNVSKNWHISSSFPSDAVISAYASPQVDKSTEPFSWGKPDLFVLRKLCWEKFAWGASKADELLLPVLKEYNKHETQLRLEAFYTFNERFAKIRSKRIEKAVKGITGSKSSDLTKDAPQPSRGGRKRKATSCKDEGDQSGSTGLDGTGASDQNKTMKKPTGKQSKRGRMDKRNSQSNLDLEQSTCVDEHVIARKESHVKGRGRNRGRGRGQQSGRGKRKNMSSYTDPEIKDCDSSSSEHEERMLHMSEEALQVRRSGRSRKTVNYSVPDESDNSEKEGATFVQGECSLVQKVSGTDESNKNQLIMGGEVGIGNAPLEEETVQSTHKTEEIITSSINGGRMDGPSDEGLASDEYLQFGGGFCLDEDEEKESSPAGEKLPEKSDVCDHLSDDEQNINDIENDSENHSLKFLRAMPNLRRKRRKN